MPWPNEPPQKAYCATLCCLLSSQILRKRTSAKWRNAFRSLPGKIAQIHDFEWGTNVSVEGIARGYTHCFFLTFLSEEDRDAYLPHPAHKEFGTVLRPHVESVLVIDYWTQR